MLSLKQLIGNLQTTCPVVAKLGISILLIPIMTPVASANPSVEATLNQFFRSDVPFPGATAQEQETRLLLRETMLQWLGDYLGARPEADHFLILFEQGSIPVDVQFDENGEPDTLTVVDCPMTSVPISQAPAEYRESLSSDCPNLTP
ncbi:hypothetical protein [Vacuolonema iberomarrocanum]|uniref:hypothetical protein n=1 Tax=Vacuolonema iberomarrocanum TaxID=3454632 RepID=UPI001A0BEB73|nr:hypothetical protein [filamentous cyanobacterium LEGE 07170]